MPVVALVGPTAVGKSSVALALARRHVGQRVEIVNGDAMQLYRGMDIGTAKADAAQRALVPHHLLDLWPVTYSASVLEYRERAREVIASLPPDALVLAVGGSGLYLTAALDRLDIPPTDPAVRARFARRLEEVGARALHAELAARDRLAAEGIDPDNGRRIVRALEVVELTGTFRSRLPQGPAPWVETAWIGLRTGWEVLDRRIGERVEAMWDAGLAREVAALVGLGLREGPTAGKAVGYAECLEYLDGRLTREEAVAATALRTRQLARRQLRWFQRDPRVSWVDVPDGADAAGVAEQVAALMGGPQKTALPPVTPSTVPET